MTFLTKGMTKGLAASALLSLVLAGCSEDAAEPADSAPQSTPANVNDERVIKAYLGEKYAKGSEIFC